MGGACCHGPLKMYTGIRCRRLIFCSRMAPKNSAANGGRTALIWAVRNHASKDAEALVKHGASTEARASDGDTALLMAASTSSDGKMVGLLLRFGAAVDQTDAHGLTPLLTSPLFSEAGSLRALVEQGRVGGEKPFQRSYHTDKMCCFFPARWPFARIPWERALCWAGSCYQTTGYTYAHCHRAT